MSVHTRRVTKGDLLLLQDISKTTFWEAFAHSNTEADMAMYLEEQLSLDKLKSELENPHTEFYFASLDNQVIAYLKLNFDTAQTAIKDKAALEIERIYVLKAFHRKKIGTALLAIALQKAKEIKAPFIWLGVWEHNKQALDFYKQQGFEAFDQHIFKLGNDEQTDLLMCLKL